MPVWWCKECGKQIAPEDLLVGPGGKQYHAACLEAFYDAKAVRSQAAAGRNRPGRMLRILLIAALGLLVGCVVGILARPTGGFAFAGAVLGSVVGGIVGQQTQ